MKLRNLVACAAAALTALISCQETEQNLGTPDITISTTEMTFEASVGNQEMTLTATRDWMAETDADWVVVSPESGEASSQEQTVTVSVLENTGMDRSADIKFTIGMKSKYLTVSQAGPGGSADALIVYFNDFDKEEATKTYGSSNGSWPYLDQFDGWMNASGTGAANVEYAYKGMSARANSTSDSDYSDYEGSGTNNMFFGSSAYFSTNNIALDGAKDLTLTFGTEKYSQDNGSVFTNSEFHIFLSNDSSKWVELTDYTFAGGTTEGRWNIASANFSVPEGTETLSICMQVDVASSYRMDDMKLVISEGGATVDFSAGVEMDFGSGSSGGQVTPPANITDVTVAEFNEKPVSTSDWYRLTGVVGGSINTTYGNYDLTDETGTVYVYGTSNWSEYSATFAKGGTVTIVGQRGDYNGKIEVLESYIESYVPGDGGSEPSTDKPESLTKVTIAEFLAAAEDDTWYELTGEITDIAKETYGNFTIKDETGEVYIYGMTSKWVGSNDQSFSQIGLKVGDVVTLGSLRTSYNGTPQGGGNPVPAFYISHVEGEGGDDTTGDDTTGDDTATGEYEPQNITWTLGEKAYDNTSGSNAQTGTINGVEVANMLKLGTGSLVGDATLHVPSGTKKLGFYCIAWKGKTATVKFSIGETELSSITPAANTGATGNPPYTITLASSDYYEIEMPTTDAVDVKVETLDASNGRALFIGLKAITE